MDANRVLVRQIDIVVLDTNRVVRVWWSWETNFKLPLGWQHPEREHEKAQKLERCVQHGRDWQCEFDRLLGTHGVLLMRSERIGCCRLDVFAGLRRIMTARSSR